MGGERAADRACSVGGEGGERGVPGGIDCLRPRAADMLQSVTHAAALLALREIDTRL